ncbi:MAG: tetratricopeptide repeat protein [Deltaproteobacteria bacterium]|nr:tetratricopeptide repeat protein [Deltaproteobacteria bacterium]
MGLSSAATMYSARSVANVLGLPSGKLRSFMRAGFVQPSKTNAGELLFSFQDLVVLRKVHGLVDGSDSPQQQNRTMKHLRRVVGTGQPLSGVELRAEGDTVVVQEGRTRWRADSGQLLMDFPASDCLPPARMEMPEVISLAEVRRSRNTPLPEENPSPPETLTAFERGCSLEDHDPEAARAAYAEAIAQDSRHADAHVNLGRLLHESGHPDAALAHYRVALSVRPADPTASFNLGVALEDTGSSSEAIRAYQASIAADPTNADAHFNLARLLELCGRPDAAFAHLVIYRKLTRAQQ